MGRILIIVTYQLLIPRVLLLFSLLYAIMQSMRTRNLEKIEDIIEVFDDWWYENLYLIWKIVHTIIDLPKNIRYTIRKIKNFWHRGIHGWAEMDTWGTDEYIMIL